MCGKIAVALALWLAAGCATPMPDPFALPESGMAWAAHCEDWDQRDKPAPPFRIYGSTFHVGTCGISAILLASPEGNILIDTGTQAGSEVVVANMASLGWGTDDLALVLHSHEHYDHVGGFAALQAQDTSVEFVASPEAAKVLRSGQDHPDDPQAGLHAPMAPVRIDKLVNNGEQITPQGFTLTAIATPGHTPGALSWMWEDCEPATGCKTIVYADSLSPVSTDDYRFSDHPEYVALYRQSIARLAALDCDILLTPHPSASGMRDKLLAGDLSAGPTCAEYAASIQVRLDARITEEAAQTR